MSFNKRILHKALPFPRFVPMHDIWIGMIAEVFGTTHFCREPLVQYRRHAGNVSMTTGESANSLRVKIRLRLTLLAGLLRRYMSATHNLMGVSLL
jgi:hypothetical protein